MYVACTKTVFGAQQVISRQVIVPPKNESGRKGSAAGIPNTMKLIFYVPTGEHLNSTQVS